MTMVMENLLLVTAMVDVVAVGTLAWLLARGSRERAAAAAEQRAALERLRGELGRLLEDAEERARGLEESLSRRERTLRSLLDELDAVERRPAAPRRAPAAAAGSERPLGRLFAAEASADETPDPAELRLRRELELRLGKGRLA